MGLEPSMFVCLTIFVIPSDLSAVEGSNGSMRDSLKQAGGNRGELETELRKVNRKDTEYLRAHASQFDLVNLMAEKIVEIASN